MKFTMEVRIGDDGIAGDPVAELSRILRYWAGNIKHYEIKPGDRAEIYDAAYAPVGSWSITG